MRRQNPQWEEIVPSSDPFRVARDEAPVIFEPGTDYEYSNPGMAMLSYAVTAAIQNGPQGDVRTLLRERIMRPIVAPDDAWSIGYENVIVKDGVFLTNGLPIVDNWGGGRYTARTAARVGRRMLRNGAWDGKRLVDAKRVDDAVTYAGLPGEGASGLGWWTNNRGDWSELPRDAFHGAGAGNQILSVIPSLDLITVRNGDQLGETYEGGLSPYLFGPLMKAVINAA